MKQNNTTQNQAIDEEFLIVPKRWLAAIEETQKKILALLQKETNTQAHGYVGDYMTETQAKKLLGRKTTWFWQLRTSGKLAFSKIGNTVYYHKDDIVKLLTKTHHNPHSEAA